MESHSLIWGGFLILGNHPSNYKIPQSITNHRDFTVYILPKYLYF